MPTFTMTTQSVAKYLTASGATGLEVTKRTIGRNPTHYSYTGKWGAGSGQSLPDAAIAVAQTIQQRRGAKIAYEADEWADAMREADATIANRNRSNANTDHPIDQHAAEIAAIYRNEGAVAAQRAFQTVARTLKGYEARVLRDRVQVTIGAR